MEKILQEIFLTVDQLCLLSAQSWEQRICDTTAISLLVLLPVSKTNEDLYVQIMT